MSKRPLTWALLLGFAFLAIGVATLNRYGASWDERENFYSGEAMLHYFVSGDTRYLDTSRNQLRPDEAYLYWWGSMFPDRYPPVTNMLAAASKHVAVDRLRLLPPVDAYHVPIIVLAALLVGAVGYLTIDRYGVGPGLFAAVALAAFPRFFGDAHNNIKDVPEAVWFSLAMLAFWRGFATQRVRWNLTGAALFAAALGTKPNALFIPIIGVIWLALLTAVRVRGGRLLGMRWPWALSLAAALPLGAAGAIASWPWLWQNRTVSGLMAHLDQFYGYLRFIGTGAKGWNLDAPAYLAITVPEIVLIFGAIGIIAAWRDSRHDADGLELLCLVWLAFPLARLCLPKTVFYDGVRHFLEVVPPLCILAGRGLSAAWPSIIARVPKPRIAAVLLGVLAVGPAIAYHPHENTYFNLLVGGYGGAQRLGVPSAEEFWAGSYREGVAWLNAHGKPGYRIMTPYAGQTMVFYRLRPDLTFVDDPHTEAYLMRQHRHGRPLRLYILKTSERNYAFQEGRQPVYARDRALGRVFEIWELAERLDLPLVGIGNYEALAPRSTARRPDYSLSLQARTGGKMWEIQDAPDQSGTITWRRLDGAIAATHAVQTFLPQYVEDGGTVASVSVPTPSEAGHYRLEYALPAASGALPVDVTAELHADSYSTPAQCRADIRPLRLPGVFPAGGTASVEVELRNTGMARWLTHGVGGRGDVHIAPRWYQSDFRGPREVPYLDQRGFLARDVLPGETAVASMDVRAPSKPGRYQLEITLVSEMVAWFNDHGTLPATLSVTVR